MVEQLVQLLIVAGLFILGLVAGTAAEKAHYRAIRRREEELSDVLVTNLRSFPGGVDISRPPVLVRGEVVVASDYAKTLLAFLKNLLGGELTTYESLLDRAAREAFIRMRDEARRLGYDAVCNVRLDTTDISGGSVRAKAMPMAVLFVNGTAYRRLRGTSGDQSQSR